VTKRMSWALSLIFSLALAIASKGPLSSPASEPAEEIPFQHVIIDKDASGATGQGMDCKAGGDIDGDGFPDVVIGSKELVWYHHPDWAKHVIAVAEKEFTTDMQLGDVDGDGDIDLSAPGKDQHTVYWFENPGNGRGDWVAHMVGRINEAEDHYADRVAMADINGDGRPDIIVTEEVSPATQGSSVYWFEQPSDPRRVNWVRHRVVTQYTTNAMDVGDVDGDGDIDIVTGKHRGSRRVAVWENRDHGKSWVEHVVDTGKEGYLGARVADLDGDGRLEILSICWDTYPHLHLWRRSVR